MGFPHITIADGPGYLARARLARILDAPDHYDASMRVGERVLLPTVRDAPADTLVVADGFSGREQIAQATPRPALHLAQVVLMARQPGTARSDAGASRQEASR